MKKIVIAVLMVVLGAVQNHAQVAIGSGLAQNMGAGKLSKESYERLKRTTTYFVVPVMYESHFDELQKMLTPAWTITPLQIISYADFKARKFDTDKSSFFSLNGLEIQGRTFNMLYIFLSLLVTEKDETYYYARVELFPNNDTYSMALRSNANDKEMSEYLNTKATFSNWETGFLKNHLQLINRQLSNQQTKWLYGDVSSKEIKILAKDTLYIPDFIFVKNKWGTTSQDEEYTEADLFSKYKYPYKIIPTADLNKKILDNEKPFNYLHFVRSGTDKYLSVIKSDDGTVLYSNYSTNSYNIKEKDIKKLISAIE